MQTDDQTSNSAQQEQRDDQGRSSSLQGAGSVQESVEAVFRNFSELQQCLEEGRATNSALQHNEENPTVYDESETQAVPDPVVPFEVVNERTTGRPLFPRIPGAVLLLLIFICFQCPIKLVSGGLHNPTTLQIASSSTTTFHVATISPTTTSSGDQGAPIENFCICEEIVNSWNLWLIPILMVFLLIGGSGNFNIKVIIVQAILLIGGSGTVFSMTAVWCYYKGFDARQLDICASILYTIVYSSLMLCSIPPICANKSSGWFKIYSVLGFVFGIFASAASCAGTITQAPCWTSVSAAINSCSVIFGCLAAYCDWKAFKSAIYLARKNLEESLPWNFLKSS